MNLRTLATAFVIILLSATMLVSSGCSAPSRTSVSQAEQKPALKCPDCAATLDARGWCAQCGAGHAKGLTTKCTSCLAAIQADGWCADCKVGYVGGQKTSCKSCFSAMSSSTGGWCPDCNVGYAKGVKTKCPSCLAAIQSDGWCEDCKVGYVGGKKTSCRNCFAAMSSDTGGWCPGCDVGYAKGLKTKCQSCFAAIAVNGRCEDCDVRFQDGRSFARVVLHVESIDSDSAASKVREILDAQQGIEAIRVDRGAGQASFELETTHGETASVAIDALVAAGYVAHVHGR